tara:strand:+ start:3760 stop:3882 length:123 start_codon:yes stop_codon:yes gene_type:complete
MENDHEITKQDKIVIGITLTAIFAGVFILGLVGLIVNIFG